MPEPIELRKVTTEARSTDGILRAYCMPARQCVLERFQLDCRRSGNCGKTGAFAVMLKAAYSLLSSRRPQRLNPSPDRPKGS